MNKIRLAAREDLPNLKEILDSIELFPSEMLEDMMAGYLENPESDDIWFTTTQDQVPISLGFCSLEKLTEGTYNLYAIGVRSDIQSKGIGSQMMGYIENHLLEKGGRILIVDTSGTVEFEATRRFYEKLGYHKEAVLRDFWAEGDDKVTYRKRLS